MLVRERFRTLELDYQLPLNHDIREVFPHWLTFVGDWKPDLALVTNASGRKLAQQCSLVHFLKEARPQNVGDLEGSSDHTFN